MGSNVSFNPGASPDSSAGNQRRRMALARWVVVAAVAGAAGGRLSADADTIVPSLACGIVAILAILAGLGTLPSQRLDPLEWAGLDALRRELDRSRRHRRSFALLRLSLAPGAATAAATTSDDADGQMLSLVGASLRLTDRAWRDGNDVIVLLPEAGRTTAADLAARLETLAPGRFAQRIGIAVFPEDGLTSGALVDALDRDSRGESVPHAIARVAGAMAEAAETTLPAGLVPPDDVAAEIG
jgi:hypothetical protein